MKHVGKAIAGKLVLVAGLAFLTLTLVGTAYGQLTPGTIVGKTNLSSFLGADGVLVQLPTPPTPGIIVGLVSTNQVKVTITNGVSYANYEVWRRPVLDSGHPWTPNIVGAPGQTNFIAIIDGDAAFFQVYVGSDWDGDGVPNSQDGDPLDPGTLLLTITIDGPANNTTVY